MGWNDHIDEQEEVEVECIKHLLESGEINHPTPQGIARQIIGKGFETLSEKQLYWFHKTIKPLIPTVCPMCETHLQAEDIYNVLVHEMNCTDCEASMASWPD